MSNFVYPKTKQAILNGEINFSSNQFKVLLVDSSQYTPNQQTDEFLSDINLNARVYTTSSISNLTNTLGTIDGVVIAAGNTILVKDNVYVEFPCKKYPESYIITHFQLGGTWIKN